MQINSNGNARHLWLRRVLPFAVRLLSLLGDVSEAAACNHYDLGECCSRIRVQVQEACKEFDMFPFEPTRCLLWEEEINTVCLNSCGNCTEMARELQNQCTFALQAINVVGPTNRRLCSSLKESFEKYRCTHACYVGGSNISYACQMPEALNCMASCGNYRACSCTRLRESYDPDRCVGETIRKGPNPDVPGVDFSCGAAFMPQICRYDILEGTCGTYRWCPPDLCVINDVVCVPPAQCIEVDMCDPGTGLCYFKNRPTGYPCDDGLFYTLDDHCDTGVCVGTINRCVQYNVSCTLVSNCLEEGHCANHTGRCTYTRKSDGTPCDDDRVYTVEDHCEEGICVGKEIDLCAEQGVICTAPNSCNDPGVCEPRTGVCGAPVLIGGRPCDDKDPTTVNDTCMNGVCIGTLVGGAEAAEFLTLGEGTCTDRDGRRMGAYSGDVSDEAECEKLCREDPQCAGYAFSYPLCSIYGTVRTSPPLESQREWSFQLSSTPPAIVLEKAMLLEGLQRQGFCRRKGLVADTVEETGKAKGYSVGTFFSLTSMTVFFLIVLCCIGMPLTMVLIWKCLCGRLDPVEDFITPPATPSMGGTRSMMSLSAIADGTASDGYPGAGSGPDDVQKLRAIAAASEEATEMPEKSVLELSPDALAVDAVPECHLDSPPPPATAEPSPPGAVQGSD